MPQRGQDPFPAPLIMSSEALPRIVLATSILFTISPVAASANDLLQMPFGEEVTKSDLVLIGDVTGVEPGSDKGQSLADIDVLGVLKGSISSRRLRVIELNGFPEEDMGPLAVHHRYMFLLYRDHKGVYRPVNGPRSAIDLGSLR